MSSMNHRVLMKQPVDLYWMRSRSLEVFLFLFRNLSPSSKRDGAFAHVMGVCSHLYSWGCGAFLGRLGCFACKGVHSKHWGKGLSHFIFGETVLPLTRSKEPSYLGMRNLSQLSASFGFSLFNMLWFRIKDLHFCTP